MIESKKKKKSSAVAVSIRDLIQEQIRGRIDTLLVDAEKFDEGNNSAGTRTRAGLQDIKNAIKEIRDAVTAVREARK